LRLTEECGANVLGYFVPALACLGKLVQLSTEHLSELHPVTIILVYWLNYITFYSTFLLFFHTSVHLQRNDNAYHIKVKLKVNGA